MTGLLAAIAAHGLPGTQAGFPREPLSALDWWTLRRGVREQRLTGLLAAAVADGALAVTEQQADECDGDLLEVISQVLVLERALLATIDLLGAAGLECRVLKGSAVAHLDYEDPVLRLFRDIDLLVRPEQFDDAVDLLLGAANERRYPQPRPGFDRRFSKGASFHSPDGLEIDLHRTFAMGPFGLTIDLPALWSRAAPFEAGGRVLSALADEDRFLHACFHAALGDVPPRLAPLRDVAQMLVGRDLDIDAVLATAASWRSEVVLARAVRASWTTMQLASTHPLVAWAMSYRPQRWEARALHAYVGAGHSSAGKSLAAVRVIPGARNKLAYVGALAFPERAYVEDRYRGRIRRWRAAAGSVLPLRAGR